MLLEQTFEKLTTLQLHGMVEALQRFTEKGAATDVSPTDLVGILTMPSPRTATTGSCSSG